MIILINPNGNLLNGKQQSTHPATLPRYTRCLEMIARRSFAAKTVLPVTTGVDDGIFLVFSNPRDRLIPAITGGRRSA